MRNFPFKGEFLIFLGALFWSFHAPIVRFLDLSPLFIAGIRSLIAGIVLLPFFRPKKIVWSYWTIVYFVSYCSLCVSIILALSMTSSVIAIGMQYTSIFWLFLADYILKKTFNSKELPSIIVIFIGILLFMTSKTSGVALKGNLIALTEGVSFALMSVSSKKCSGDNPAGLTALANIFTSIVVFLIFPTTLSGISLVSGSEWLFLLILGTFQVAGGYLFYNMGLKDTTAEKATIIALWEIVLGPLWILLFFREYPGLQVTFGLLIIVLGLFLNTHQSRTKGNPALDNLI